MIFKRAAARLRAQDWTAIAIELAIVIVGVFVGVQAANWNQALADRSRASGYLERIQNDLEADLSNYRNRMHFWTVVSAYGQAGLDYAETGRAGTRAQWQLLLAYFQASQVAEFFTTSATYEELKSAGELGLIRNLTLRNALATYYTNAGNPALSERPAYRLHIRGIIPLDVQNYIWTNCYFSNERGEQELRNCPSPVSNERAAHIVDSIRHDPALIAELRYWMSTLHVASLIGRDRAKLAGQILDSVNAEIGAKKRDIESSVLVKR